MERIAVNSCAAGGTFRVLNKSGQGYIAQERLCPPDLTGLLGNGPFELRAPLAADELDKAQRLHRAVRVTALH